MRELVRQPSLLLLPLLFPLRPLRSQLASTRYLDSPLLSFLRPSPLSFSCRGNVSLCAREEVAWKGRGARGGQPRSCMRVLSRVRVINLTSLGHVIARYGGESPFITRARTDLRPFRTVRYLYFEPEDDEKFLPCVRCTEARDIDKKYFEMNPPPLSLSIYIFIYLSLINEYFAPVDRKIE